MTKKKQNKALLNEIHEIFKSKQKRTKKTLGLKGYVKASFDQSIHDFGDAQEIHFTWFNFPYLQTIYNLYD